MSEFQRLQPAIFSGTERPLETEQWLVDTTDPLKATRISDESQVEVAKIQLKDVTRTWWLAEEARLEKPISWDRFSMVFYERFFLAIAQKEMKEQFIKLQHWNQSVDEYTTEFLRLNRFAPYMVTNEEKRASRFQQGLKMGIQMLLILQQLKTYSQVLTITREVERGLEKKNRSQMQNEHVKRPFSQMNRGNPARAVGAPLAKRPFQHPPQQIVYEYCQKPGHTRNTCKIANGLCLASGSDNQTIGDCPFKRIWNVVLAPPTLPARATNPALPLPPMRRNPGPIGKGTPPPPPTTSFWSGPKSYSRPREGSVIQLDHRGS